MKTPTAHIPMTGDSFNSPAKETNISSDINLKDDCTGSRFPGHQPDLQSVELSGSLLSNGNPKDSEGVNEFGAISFEPGMTGSIRGDMRKYLRKLLMASAGQIGMSAVSAGALYLAIQFSIGIFESVWQVFAALGVVRLWYFLTRGRAPVLAKYRIRKQIWWVISDELQIAVALIAICFVLSWPFTISTCAIFIGLNLIAELAMLVYSRFVTRSLAEDTRKSGSNELARKAIILGTGSHARLVADKIVNSPELDTKVVGFFDYRRKGMWRYRDIPLLGHPDKLESTVLNGQVDAIFVAVEPHDITNSRELFYSAESMGVPVFVIPNVYYPQVSKIRPAFVNGMPAMEYRSAPANSLSLFVKNAIDRIGAFCGLILISPILATAAIAVKFGSKGPTLFKQERSGINGRRFNLYKFRTMCDDAEEKKESLSAQNEMSGPVFKINKDPRITKTGRFLRKYSIDELPQLINVLKGEMSLVGPRPPLPKEVSKYSPWQHRRLSVKPGVTCLWQVNGRNDIGFEDWMKLDLEYIDNWSLWLDTRILFKTIPAVLKGSGV